MIPQADGGPDRLLASALPFVAAAAALTRSLPQERRRLLNPAADWAVSRLGAGGGVHFNFICTANSRRSHLGQVWAEVAARFFGLHGIRTFSGGIVATACNPRTVAALARSGLSVSQSTEGSNPVFQVRYSADVDAIELYSKRYDAAVNPAAHFAAMMCCADADEACPVVRGASIAVPLHYGDPTKWDGTSRESRAYDELSETIAVEMLYLMGCIRASV